MMLLNVEKNGDKFMIEWLRLLINSLLAKSGISALTPSLLLFKHLFKDVLSLLKSAKASFNSH